MVDSSPSRPTVSAAPELTIVLATLNEGANLPELFRRIEAVAPVDREIVVVDDGSMDGSRGFLDQLAASDPRVRLIYHDEPQTTLRAHLLGIQAARGRAVLIMDADLQHPPETIPALLAGLRAGADVAVATRYAPGGRTRDRSVHRAIISRVAQFLAHAMLASARDLSDPMSGFFVFRRASVPQMDPSPRGFKVLLYLLASSPPLRVSEVAYEFEVRAHGESKVVQGWGFLRMYLRELRRARRIERETRRAPPAVHLGARSPGASDPPPTA